MNNISEYGLCCGCGVCAAVCPVSAISIKFNRVGEYHPVVSATQCTHCRLCLRCCPIDGEPNEDAIGKSRWSKQPNIQYQKFLGFYRQNYLGVAPDPVIARNGASGGMCTWTLCRLLEEKKIDRAVVVTATGNPERLYEFIIASNIEQIRSGAKSSYYPVELSEVLRVILQEREELRYAIVGLPCLCKAIRRACLQNQKLNRRITYVLGLVCCGQQATTQYTAEIGKMAHLTHPVKKIVFRDKSPGIPAECFVMNLTDTKENTARILFSEGPGKFWHEGTFRLNSCNFCDDPFAECADATFMDVWLPQYARLDHGTNAVICRDSWLQELYREVPTLSAIPPETVLACQPFFPKIASLQTRLRLRKYAGKKSPAKRHGDIRESAWNGLRTAIFYIKYHAVRRNLARDKEYDSPSALYVSVCVIQRVLECTARCIRIIKGKLR